MPSTKRLLEYANEEIRHIREDITLYGASAKAYLYLSKASGKIIGYSPAANEDKILYIDEECVETTLFNVLWNYIAAAKLSAGHKISKIGIWVTTARLCLDLTMQEFAKLLGVSTIAVQTWELGTRNPKLDKLIKLAKKYNYPYDGLF